MADREVADGKMRKGIRKTRYGIINYQHRLGTTYVTERRPDHYFIKYKGFAISKSELDVLKEEEIYWILIMYRNKKGVTIPHLVRRKEVEKQDEYNNKGDIQKIIPIRIRS